MLRILRIFSFLYQSTGIKCGVCKHPENLCSDTLPSLSRDYPHTRLSNWQLPFLTAHPELARDLPVWLVYSAGSLWPCVSASTSGVGSSPRRSCGRRPPFSGKGHISGRLRRPPWSSTISSWPMRVSTDAGLISRTLPQGIVRSTSLLSVSRFIPFSNLKCTCTYLRWSKVLTKS